MLSSNPSAPVKAVLNLWALRQDQLVYISASASEEAKRIIKVVVDGVHATKEIIRVLRPDY